MMDKITCVSTNNIFDRQIFYKMQEGQHQIGFYIGRRGYSAEDELEICLLNITEEEFENLIENDPGIQAMNLTHYTKERGLFSATWYFIMYEDRNSSYFKPTKLVLDYDEPLTVEIIVALSEDDRYYTRIFTYSYKTNDFYTIGLNNLDIEEMLESLFNDNAQGLSMGEDDDVIYVDLFDNVGNKNSIEFESLNELSNHVVSIRYI